MRGIHHNPLRTCDPNALSQALQTTRAYTLALIADWVQALPSLQVPYDPGLNPPLWEWGHMAWFQEWWTVRNTQRLLGTRSASDGGSFTPSLLEQADALYNSSQVAHASRWSLDLPDLQGTLEYLDATLQLSLDHLEQIKLVDDDALYFWRLALFHEAMHNEASVYMAQALGMTLEHALQHHGKAFPSVSRAPKTRLSFSKQPWVLGHEGAGFAFDNECAAHTVEVQAFDIDSQPITWGEYIPFLAETGHVTPPYIRCLNNPKQTSAEWQIKRGHQWLEIDYGAYATHINAHDAQAWCDWAGRRLPTEAEWSCASQHPDFEWGQVWEWTASPFEPFVGFQAHPYQDYSAPWWHTHRVLKGASWATPPSLIDCRFRNFFTPQRHDIFCGFRSVAL